MGEGCGGGVGGRRTGTWRQVVVEDVVGRDEAGLEGQRNHLHKV